MIYLSHMKSKGFTLIELLVVVAIIGILATVVLASLGSARTSAEDAKRLAIVKELQNALEMYYLDNGRYPEEGTTSWGTTTYQTSDRVELRNLENLLAPYMKIDFNDRLWSQAITGGIFAYNSTTVDNNQTYGIGIGLISSNNTSLALNDGGYSNWYEVGQLPVYCKNKYTGTGGAWWHAGNELCAGGN